MQGRKSKALALGTSLLGVPFFRKPKEMVANVPHPLRKMDLTFSESQPVSYTILCSLALSSSMPPDNSSPVLSQAVYYPSFLPGAIEMLDSMDIPPGRASGIRGKLFNINPYASVQDPKAECWQVEVE
jgi:hypothetical protein